MNSPALQAALDAIDREFGMAAFHRSRKRRVRLLFKYGPTDRGIQLRYGWLAERASEIGPCVEVSGAVAMMDLCHRQQLKANGRNVRLYANSFRLLDATTIFTMRLLLRWLRRQKNGQAQFDHIIAAMTEAPARQAAE